MKKVGLIMGTIASLLLSMNTVVWAAGPLTVTFSGSSDIQYEGREEFADNFADMLPGESRTEEIVLRNEDDKSAEFYLQSQVLKAFEDTVDASGAAYNISLQLHKGSKTSVIFGGPEEGDSARIGGDEEGLANLNEAMGDWVYLTELAPGESATLEMLVALDGESSTNDYQQALGTFSFEFGVDYPSPAPKADPVVNKKYVKGDPRYVTKTVKTGDDAPILALLTMGAAALGVLTVVGKKSRKAD